MFVVVVVAVTVTMLIASIVMNTSLGPKVAIPGPLSAQHALLSEDCGNCHGADMESTKGVLHGMLNSGLSLRDSGRCQNCHDLGDDALQAHGLTPATLVGDTERAVDREREVVAPPTGFGLPPHSERGEYACSVCHWEHRGRDVDLTAMSDSQCQACHATRFESFSHGHPEFGGYPYRRRLRIAFDHAAHIYHNFLTKDQSLPPASCVDCHTPDASGDFMLTVPFERVCVRCHENDTTGSARSGGAGIAFLTLPALDTITLDEEGVGIGQWPADSGIAEGKITPFMRLLLGGDPGVAADLRTVDALDLLDLQGADRAELDAVGRIAWAIKALLLDLADDGHGAISARLERALGADRASALSPRLAGSLSRSLVRECVGSWLPDLRGELSRRASGGASPTDALGDERFDESGAAGQEWSSLGGWYRDDLAFSIMRRPTGHADTFLRAWADLAASEPGRGAALLDALSAPDAVGQCLKCHSVDRVSDAALRVNWRARRPADSGGALTKFSHAPHLPLLGPDGCLRCHGVEPQTRDFELSYFQRDPGVFVSSLTMMSREGCAECHTPSRVSTTCLDCHDYHTHRPRMRLRDGAPLKPPATPADPAEAVETKDEPAAP